MPEWMSFWCVSLKIPEEGIDCFFLPIYTFLRTLRPLMAVHARKRGDESNDRLQSRFKSQVQKKGDLKALRGKKAFSKKPTKRAVRQQALKREEYRAKNRKRQFYSNM